VRTFFSDLARTGKGMKEVKILTDQAYGSMSSKREQVNKMIKEVKVYKIMSDQRRSHKKKKTS
jgi:hypothetical protein